MNVLSVAAIICLPRQFQITVVENSDENHLRTASWAFPAYLLLMSLFTLPIALFGLTSMPAGSNPDMFVLTLPLAAGQEGLALFAFIGGFSSATSMIIVESIALSIMVSNHIVMPIVLRFTHGPRACGDGQGVSQLLLNSRRFSIALILLAGLLLFLPDARFRRAGADRADLVLPAWRSSCRRSSPRCSGARRRSRPRPPRSRSGFVVWAWSSFLPSFEIVVAAGRAADGARARGASRWLRPRGPVRPRGLDPLVHAVFWSLFLNTATLVVVSLLTTPVGAGADAGDAVRRCVPPRRPRQPQFHPRLGHGQRPVLRRRSACSATDARARAVRDAAREAASSRCRADARIHRPAGARTRRLDRRRLGPCDAVQGGLGRRGVARGSDADGRRDPAGDRIFPGAGTDLGGTALDRRTSSRTPTRSCANSTARRTSS